MRACQRVIEVVAVQRVVLVRRAVFIVLAHALRHRALKPDAAAIGVTLIAVVLGLFIYFSHGPAAPRFDQGDFDATPAGLNR